MRNVLRMDPSRTGLLRRKFVFEARRHFNAIAKAIKELIKTDDVFGLKPTTTLLVFHAQSQTWRFQTDVQKLTSFKAWLKKLISLNLLSVSADAISGKPWTATYIYSAYRQGLIRAYVDTLAKGLSVTQVGFQAGSQAQFLNMAFNQPELRSKIELLYTRAYDGLEGITNDMSLKIGRVLSEDLVNGVSPSDMADDLVKEVGLSRNRAETLARTEVVYAQAEGQLDSFELLGVEDVGLMAEWETMEDDDVCDECDPLDGVVMPVDEARGLLPRHPNCRCCWLPALEDTREQGQKYLQSDINAALEASVSAEPTEESEWLGSELL